MSFRVGYVDHGLTITGAKAQKTVCVHTIFCVSKYKGFSEDNKYLEGLFWMNRREKSTLRGYRIYSSLGDVVLLVKPVPC